MTETPARQPQGIPTGGQFAATSHTEPTIALASAIESPYTPKDVPAAAANQPDGTFELSDQGGALPDQSDETVTFTTRACMICGKTSDVQMTADQAAAIKARTPIQNVLPDADVPTREMITSGTHPACWDLAFGEP